MRRSTFLKSLALGTASVATGSAYAKTHSTATAPPVLPQGAQTPPNGQLQHGNPTTQQPNHPTTDTPTTGTPTTRNPEITAVEAFAFKKACFVCVTAGDGTKGWGEANHDTPLITAQVINDRLAKRIVGEPVWDSAEVGKELYFKEEDLGNTGLLPGCIAGIDNALWDLKGKLVGQPVHHLLGGNGERRFRAYGSFGRGFGRKQKSDAELVKLALDFVDKGYEVLKVRMQIRQLNVDPFPDDTYASVKAVAEAIPDDVQLMVDFNNGYTPAQAIRIGKRLVDDFGIVALEEPISYQNYDGLAEVADALPIAIACGEHEYNRWQYRDLITRGNPALLNLDVIKACGISECFAVAQMGWAFDKYVMVHNARPTLQTAASVALLGSIPNAFHVQEHAGERPELGLNHLFESMPRFEDGYLYVSEAPGVGLEVREDLVRKEALNG